MSTITLSAAALNALLVPVSSVPVPASDPAWLAKVVKIADTVKSLTADGFTSAQIKALFNEVTATPVIPAQTTPAPKAAKVKSAGKLAWRTKAPSESQLARYNRLETALNAHYGENCDLSTMADFVNSGDLSDQYKLLAATGSALGLKWAA